MKWEEENIPNNSYLFRRIPSFYLVDKDYISPNAFQNKGKGMSVDWDKYSTPEQTRNRVLPRLDPLEFGVVKQKADKIRNIEEQFIKHEPSIRAKNRAHTVVIGSKTPKIRRKFQLISQWIIKPFDPNIIPI